MIFFVLVATVAGGVLSAVAWVRYITHRHPTSSTGVVLSSIDDRALAGGIAAGLGMTACDALTSGTWLGWSWGDPITDSTLRGAQSSPAVVEWTVAIVLLAAITLAPLLVAVVIPVIALAATAALAYSRVERGRRLRPALTVPVAAVLAAAIGFPIAVAVCYGILVAVIGTLVRRKPPVPDVALALPSRLTGRQLRKPDADPQSWELLDARGRYHSARVAAVNVVTLMASIVSGSALTLLAIT